jgi:hypothetical protein
MAELEASGGQELLLAQRTELREKWDTQFAGAAHFVIDALLEFPSEERNVQLINLKKRIDDWVRAKKDKTAGDYESQELTTDIFREIIYRVIARLPGREIITKEELVNMYKQLDSEVYTHCPPVNWGLIGSLNSGEQNDQTALYLDQITKICDVLVKADVNDKDQREIMEQIIYKPATVRGTEIGFKIEDARKLRIFQDLILNLINRLPLKTGETEQDWLRTLEKNYLPGLNATKVELYNTGNQIEKLSRSTIF